MRSVHESPLAYSHHPCSSRFSPEMDPSFATEQFSLAFPPIIFSPLRVYFYDSINSVSTFMIALTQQPPVKGGKSWHIICQ